MKTVFLLSFSISSAFLPSAHSKDLYLNCPLEKIGMPSRYINEYGFSDRSDIGIGEIRVKIVDFDTITQKVGQYGKYFIELSYYLQKKFINGTRFDFVYEGEETYFWPNIQGNSLAGGVLNTLYKLSVDFRIQLPRTNNSSSKSHNTPTWNEHPIYQIWGESPVLGSQFGVSTRINPQLLFCFEVTEDDHRYGLKE